ncbi:hypothetical protein BKA70DRAFT_1344904 [Coprinopsis sp. MPI-PUGE-AT-0042]|nr:hypothetical protein BKA70DRAFT_1344904 [Coprinopsis sp. MPI-PUGE-AT-0042]
MLGQSVTGMGLAEIEIGTGTASGGIEMEKTRTPAEVPTRRTGEAAQTLSHSSAAEVAVGAVPVVAVVVGISQDAIGTLRGAMQDGTVGGTETSLTVTVTLQAATETGRRIDVLHLLVDQAPDPSPALALVHLSLVVLQSLDVVDGTLPLSPGAEVEPIPHPDEADETLHPQFDEARGGRADSPIRRGGRDDSPRRPRSPLPRRGGRARSNRSLSRSRSRSRSVGRRRRYD